jgi:hypothetical protein
MKPLCYSVRTAFDSGIGWKRTDYVPPASDLLSSVCYYKVPRDCEDGTRKYILTFTHLFEHPGDKVYFAYCFPYTYTGVCISAHLSPVVHVKHTHRYAPMLACVRRHAVAPSSTGQRRPIFCAGGSFTGVFHSILLCTDLRLFGCHYCLCCSCVPLRLATCASL